MKRVQHFIPRFILKNFLDKGFFKFFDKRYGKYSDKTPGGSMYKEYFYEHDDFELNEIEDLLARRENLYAPIIEKIINQIPLTLEEHKILIEFRHTTHYRSNEFIGFHRFQTSRGKDDWMQRLDWKMINGIYESNDWDKDIKRSQLKAIKSVVDGKDAAYSLSTYTPICFLFTSKDKKFMVSDSGSLCWGDEVDGMIIIVLSPIHALMFPRIKNAIKSMEELGVTNQQSTIKYKVADNEFVDFVNKKVLENSFEYYIDPNLDSDPSAPWA